MAAQQQAEAALKRAQIEEQNAQRAERLRREAGACGTQVALND